MILADIHEPKLTSIVPWIYVISPFSTGHYTKQKNKIKLCIPLLMETKLKLFLEKNAADFASRRITAVFQMCPK